MVSPSKYVNLMRNQDDEKRKRVMDLKRVPAGTREKGVGLACGVFSLFN